MNYTARAYAITLRDVSTNLDEFRRVIRDGRMVSDHINEDTDVRAFLTDRRVDATVQGRVLAAGFAATDERIQRMIQTMVMHRQLSLLPKVVDTAERLADAEEGSARVLIESAEAVPEELRKRLQLALGRQLQKKFSITYVEHPKLLGGLRVTIDDHRCWDGTIAGKLERLRAHLRDLV